MAIPQAEDFTAECHSLHELIEVLQDHDLEQQTQFRGWTIEDIIGHLHFWNFAATAALLDPAGFADFRRDLLSSLARDCLRDVESQWRADLRGRSLVAAWHCQCLLVGDRFAAADPKQRVQWIGPGMSALSCIASRQMETWAHGQAIFDLLGAERIDTDRLRSIAHLGVNTFAWSFTNRGMEIPPRQPRVTLRAPSGAIWEWHADSTTDSVTGSATEFCQVVTQTRALGDTALRVTGSVAQQWMAIAQCFAGPPVDPPPPGSRYLRPRRTTPRVLTR